MASSNSASYFSFFFQKISLLDGVEEENFDCSPPTWDEWTEWYDIDAVLPTQVTVFIK